MGVFRWGRRGGRKRSVRVWVDGGYADIHILYTHKTGNKTRSTNQQNPPFPGDGIVEEENITTPQSIAIIKPKYSQSTVGMCARKSEEHTYGWKLAEEKEKH